VSSREATLLTAMILLASVGFILALLSLVHLNLQPPETFARAGKSRSRWIGLLFAAVVFPFPCVVFPIVYLVSVRKRLAATRPG
jgi:hypothetical protein